jgi:hypothetical protein
MNRSVFTGFCWSIFLVIVILVGVFGLKHTEKKTTRTPMVKRGPVVEIVTEYGAVTVAKR